MLEALKGWIITLCSAVFFITAIQMILPDNKIKKYCNFTLGLLLIVIIINPIIRVVNSEIDINSEIDKAANQIFSTNTDTDYKKYRETNLENTLENFEQNLKNTCEKDLENKFKDNNFQVEVSASYNSKENLFQIDSFQVALDNSNVKKIEKIQIGNIGEDSIKVNKMQEEDPLCLEVKNYLINEYDIDEEKILVYRENSN